MQGRVDYPAAMSAQTQPKQRSRILVVDDNYDAAESLAMMLDVMGYEVRTAHDGLEAVRAADEFHPAVALLDIGLPHVSGYDVARHIRKSLGSDVLLVAITGWGTAEDVRRSMDAGFDHHFTKPADPDRLKKILLTACPPAAH
jgi:DNA-binding response OmpR family regulator